MTLPRLLRDLHRRKARERRGLALAEGVRLVEEMLAAGADCKGAAVAPGLLATPRGVALRAALDARGIPVEHVGDDELADLAATEHPQGIVAVVVPPRWTLDDMIPMPRRPVVVLDALQDPGNVGTIARTALAFGAIGLIALPGTADLSAPKTWRSAMGALFRLPHLLVEAPELAAWQASHHVVLWAASAAGAPFEPSEAPDRLGLVFGNEGAGVSDVARTLIDREVGIPMQPDAESLNVAVAAGILLYQGTR